MNTQNSHRDLDKTLSAAGSATIVAAVKRYMAMIEIGQAPTLDQFCLEYPDLAEELRPCLAGLVLIEQGFGKGRPSDSASIHKEPGSDFEMPTALGDFRIVREIGRGGMGIVYEAQQLSLGRRVALKVLSFASGLDPVRLQRFRNEAQSAAQLHHTHIVPVYAVGSDRGVHYFAMQFIDGHSLAQVVESIRQTKKSIATKESSTHVEGANASTQDSFELDATMSMDSRSSRNRYYRSVAKIVVQAAEGLAHAHLYGVVHRDIKPANLMLDPVGNIWITDFGLAQIQSDSNLTRSGDMLGTLRYMSPEQSSGGKTPMDHRTDIYSLGVTLYEMLTLQPAITGTGYQEIIKQIAEEDPPSPRSIDPNLPLELEIITQKAIAKYPVDRYETASLMAEDLQRWLEDKPILAKPPTLFQRFAKWRRRHSSLVAVATVFSALACLGLLVTTVVVIREQIKTASALTKEKQQRAVAEISFQQARRAVDTFSELSETELANRPDLKSLRREFLEASLNFYQDFIELRGDDPMLQDELSASKQRVEKMVVALTRLDRLEPLKLLSYASIRKELALSPEDSNVIEQLLDKAEHSSGEIPVDDAQSSLATNLLAQFEIMSEKLNELQWKRLREIHRQLRLPFTFKSIETAQALSLSQAQRQEIGLIIEQERPDRMANNAVKGDKPIPDRNRFPMEPPPEEDRYQESLKSGRGPKGPPRDDLGPPRGERGRGGDGRRPPDGGPGSRRGRNFDQTLFASQTAKTVKRIILILTPQQQLQWQELIGKPFEFEDF